MQCSLFVDRRIRGPDQWRLGRALMVEKQVDHPTGDIRFVLCANSSMANRQVTIVLIAAGLVIVGIGCGFAMLGLWGVLPFSGAEWIALAYAFRFARRKSLAREVLTIGESTVMLEKGCSGVESVFRFQRAWVRLECAPPVFRGYPARIMLRSHGKEVEVGSFLPELERNSLVLQLRQILV